MDENKKPSEQDLLKAVSEVLDEALSTYEQLTKTDGIDGAHAIDDMKGQAKGVVGEGTGTKPMMAKAGEEDKDDKKDKDKDKDMEKSDDELVSTYKSLVAKMEERGLMEKGEKKDKMKKSETEEVKTAPVAVDMTESLRKSVDERFESLAKAIKDVAETVKKIASTPVARKGVAGYQPLKKSEGSSQPTLKKGEVLGKLLELRKDGDNRVDTGLINRIETGRLFKGDEERIRSLGILGE